MDSSAKGCSLVEPQRACVVACERPRDLLPVVLADDTPTVAPLRGFGGVYAQARLAIARQNRPGGRTPKSVLNPCARVMSSGDRRRIDP